MIRAPVHAHGSNYRVNCPAAASTGARAAGLQQQVNRRAQGLRRQQSRKCRVSTRPVAKYFYYKIRPTVKRKGKRISPRNRPISLFLSPRSARRRAASACDGSGTSVSRSGRKTRPGRTRARAVARRLVRPHLLNRNGLFVLVPLLKPSLPLLKRLLLALLYR